LVGISSVFADSSDHCRGAGRRDEICETDDQNQMWKQSHDIIDPGSCGPKRLSFCPTAGTDASRMKAFDYCATLNGLFDLPADFW
jgi:hypothetical protein